MIMNIMNIICGRLGTQPMLKVRPFALIDTLARDICGIHGQRSGHEHKVGVCAFF